VCVLVGSSGLGPQGRHRLELVASTEDGFALAEEDLKTRGMGDLQGIRQHGEMPLKLLNPLSDSALVEAARAHAEAVLQADPLLRRREHRPLAAWLDHLGSRNPFWSSTG
jgi:ATP-dependent DNA helicase RecG